MVHPLQSLLDEGVEQGIFPSAQAVVLRKGQRLFEVSCQIVRRLMSTTRSDCILNYRFQLS